MLYLGTYKQDTGYNKVILIDCQPNITVGT